MFDRVLSDPSMTTFGHCSKLTKSNKTPDRWREWHHIYNILIEYLEQINETLISNLIKSPDVCLMFWSAHWALILKEKEILIKKDLVLKDIDFFFFLIVFGFCLFYCFLFYWLYMLHWNYFMIDDVPWKLRSNLF